MFQTYQKYQLRDVNSQGEKVPELWLGLYSFNGHEFELSKY